VRDFDVVWTLNARDELELIYEYYLLKSEIVAMKIIEGILYRANQLRKFPLSEQYETALKKINKEYRYLVEGNYKIIYRVSENLVFITDVFDVRQSPKKIARHK
jgi:toxin ParE1/3/4